MDLVSKLSEAVTGGKAGGGSKKAKKAEKKAKKAAKKAEKAQQAQQAAKPQAVQAPLRANNVAGSSLNQYFSGSTPGAGGPDLLNGLSSNFGV